MFFTRFRGGLPNVGEKFRSGKPIVIMAYGTSMTHDGFYLTGIEQRFRDGGAEVRVDRIGLRAASSESAAFQVDRVAELEPDLVIFEFAINDAVRTENPFAKIPEAMHAIIGRIREAVPQCDFASVYFEHSSMPYQSAVSIAIHEGICAYYDFPSFHLNDLAREALRSGFATLAGGARPITTDGTHHTKLAGSVIGEPFADALYGVVRDSPRTVRHRPPAPRTLLSDARSFRIRDVEHGDHWKFTDGRPLPGDLGGTVAFFDIVSIAKRSGVTAHFDFEGTSVVVWAHTGLAGKVIVRLDGVENTVPIHAEPSPRFLGIRTDASGTGVHRFEVSVSHAGMILGDVCLIGRRVENARPTTT
jgi:lysophospholipase L1-like esterase